MPKIGVRLCTREAVAYLNEYDRQPQILRWGGDESGGNLHSSTYAVNVLNQCTSRTVPGAVDIIGAANSTSTVTVNNTPSYRHGDYFRNQSWTNNDARRPRASACPASHALPK